MGRAPPASERGRAAKPGVLPSWSFGSDSPPGRASPCRAQPAQPTKPAAGAKRGAHLLLGRAAPPVQAPSQVHGPPRVQHGGAHLLLSRKDERPHATQRGGGAGDLELPAALGGVRARAALVAGAALVVACSVGGGVQLRAERKAKQTHLRNASSLMTSVTTPLELDPSCSRSVGSAPSKRRQNSMAARTVAMRWRTSDTRGSSGRRPGWCIEGGEEHEAEVRAAASCRVPGFLVFAAEAGRDRRLRAFGNSEPWAARFYRGVGLLARRLAKGSAGGSPSPSPSPSGSAPSSASASASPSPSPAPSAICGATVGRALFCCCVKL